MQQESTKTQSTKESAAPKGKSGDTSKKKAKPTKKKATKKSRGLGDTVAKVTKATGVDKVVKAIAGDDCGCNERQEALNKAFPYIQPMSEESKTLWETVIQPANERGRMTAPDQHAFIRVYAQVYQTQLKFTSCGGCLVQKIDKLRKAYEAACD